MPSFLIISQFSNNMTESLSLDFRKKKYINLITFTKQGKAIGTPVWFAEKDGLLYVPTEKRRYKIRRIQNDSKVQFAPCSFRGSVKGPYYNGTAQVLSNEEEGDIGRATLKKKYRFYRFFDSKRKTGEKEMVIIEIKPSGKIVA